MPSARASGGARDGRDASAASEPRKRSAPAKRRARACREQVYRAYEQAEDGLLDRGAQYLASEPTTETFRTFLQTHASLLRVAPTWTIRIVFPRPLDHAYEAYQAVIHEELESPLHSATIGELQSHFELRLEAAREEPMHPLTRAS